MKMCNRCKKMKPLSEFHVGKMRKPVGKCARCRLDVKNIWRLKNKEKVHRQYLRQKENAATEENRQRQEQSLRELTEKLLPEYHGEVCDGLRLIKCIRCSRVLPLMFFVKTPTTVIGYNRTCSDCTCAKYGKGKPTKIERVAFNITGRILDGEKYCSGCGFIKDIEEFHHASRNRDGRHTYCTSCRCIQNRLSSIAYKRRAHNEVQKALQKGLLTVPENCEQCESVGPLEAHHDDYSKPLEIKWLCKKCHHDTHQSIRYVSMEFAPERVLSVKMLEDFLGSDVESFDVYYSDDFKKYVMIKMLVQS